MPIRKPLKNYKCYVIDEFGRRLSPFMPGELLIVGCGVGRGYLNQPDLTQKAFIKNPFDTGEDYARTYRSGDVVRLLANGEIGFIGRNDGQVKVRGFRIELTEVEGVIREYPGIADATVQAFEDKASGVKFIAAYVVSDDTMDVSALNAFILERKPPYMVPAVTVQIDAIPLNQNQKVNKKALPVPEFHAIKKESGPAQAAPLNVLEKELKDIFLSSSLAAILAEEYDISGLFVCAGGEKMRNFCPHTPGNYLINVNGSTETSSILSKVVFGNEERILTGKPPIGTLARFVDEDTILFLSC